MRTETTTNDADMQESAPMRPIDQMREATEVLARRIAELEAALEAALSAKQEPDWTDSETGLLECWKNRLHPMSDRLLMADGAIAFRDKIIANLRSQLASLSAKQERISELEAKNAQLLGALRYFMSAVENSSHLDARRGIMDGAFDIAHAAIAAVQSNASTHELNSANSLE